MADEQPKPRKRMMVMSLGDFALLSPEAQDLAHDLETMRIQQLREIANDPECPERDRAIAALKELGLEP